MRAVPCFDKLREARSGLRFNLSALLPPTAMVTRLFSGEAACAGKQHVSAHATDANQTWRDGLIY